VTHDFSGNCKSFEPLIRFLRFLVQKLRPKQLNLDKNYLKDFYPNFGYTTLTSEPETLEI